ncbi:MULTISPECIES: DUF5719 family protein [unclassified Rathayibacter]|uniref:DUF5719 family protein n=1 Tax=unclassified Rathayibacter TaxID=2609250 RepID=UPI0006F830FC|nr:MULTISPECIES: DUF5719 family protein [unclassified Rathayibacter]KQP97578.1 hypothetical protein ASF42_18040 [Rathayibacter sp. Leaf294]KQS07250.1 hypothetical protein ASG06_18775 [Rathayibacter sp. Leaf185]
MSDPTDQETPAKTAAPARPERAERRRRAATTTTPARRAPSAARRRRSALRAAAGVAGLAMAAAAVVLPQVLPLPEVSRAAEGVVVSPVAADGALVCGGDLIDAGEPEELLAFAGSATAVWPADSVSDSRALTEADVAAPGSGIDGLSVPADSDPTPGGVTTQSIANESVSGLSAHGCAEPTADSWLVAGSTDVGRTSVLVLANASEVAATVDLALYGEQGPVSATGATGIVVPAGSVRALPLAGLAPDVVQPVVHVTARGGEVAASLQSSAISGLTPEGVEISAPSASPATVAVIAGFTVASAPAETASDDGSGGEGVPVLRILAPGDADSTVSVEVANEDPSGLGASTQVVVAAGRVGEVPLTGLADGSYRVTLSSDQPIVAAGRTTSTGPAGTDFAWFASGTATSTPFGVASTGEAGARLHLANASDSSASVVIDSPAGSRTLEIGPYSAASTELGTDSAVVSSDQPVQASVSIASDGRIASYPVVPPGPLSSPVTVYSH